MPLYWEKQDNVALPLDSMGIMSYPFQSRWQIYIYIYIFKSYMNFSTFDCDETRSWLIQWSKWMEMQAAWSINYKCKLWRTVCVECDHSFYFNERQKKKIKSKQKQKIPEFLSKKIGWKGAYRNFQRENVFFFNRIYFKSIFMFFYFDRIQISKFNRLICSSQFKSQNKQMSKDKKKNTKLYWNITHYEEVFENVTVVDFQSVFSEKRIYIFYFLKIIFNINTLKRFKNI